MRLEARRFMARGDAPDQVSSSIDAALSGLQPDLVVLFSTRDCDMGALTRALQESLRGPVLGCTTAGEIGPEGFQQGTVVGVALWGALDVDLIPIPELDRISSSAMTEAAARCVAHTRRRPEGWSSFGVLLIDGLSGAEERLMAGLSSQLPELQLVGGSAGDDLRFGETGVWWEGAFHSNLAVLAVINTAHPWSLIKTQHIVDTDDILVITEADRRVVYEIDGRPAAAAYADHVGVPIESLGPEIFSRHPMVLRIEDEVFVRSIHSVGPDQSLSFLCAIEEGLVMSLGRGADLLPGLESELAAVSAGLGEEPVFLAFDCILRRLEVQARALDERARQIVDRYDLTGFHTYGEQRGGVHVNQTFTGVALGRGT